ncbi:MAG: hypothetical protein HQL14_01215 [Candidatus Omnitrophica bacterium]|nr:hypothetical protein [Candidatus Omnitrophota bacterium]
MNKNGFMLLEAILTVVIVSVCLTFIVQALLTNFRTGMRFQETVRSFLIMENKLGLLYATHASEDQLNLNHQSLEEPYDKFTVSTRTDNINDHLKQVTLILNWPAGQKPGSWDLTTVINIPNGTQASS